MSEPQFSAPMETVRKRKLEATQRLLGDTIGMDEDQWRAPSLLPGWTRAHVAVHLARGADALEHGLDLSVVHDVQHADQPRPSARESGAVRAACTVGGGA